MKIVVTDGVKNFLKKKNLNCITVNLYISSSCCTVTSAPTIEHKMPANPSNYDFYKIDNINIYISKSIKTEEELKFVLKSHFKLKYVEVYGVKLI